MSAESRSWVEEVDVNQLRTDPEKLCRVAEDLKHKLLKSYDQLETIRREQVGTKSPVPSHISDSSSHWPGRLWVPAETNYPSDDAGRLSCLRDRHIEVLVYDCKTDKTEVFRGLDKLYDKKALFTKLPSRRAGKLRVCIEQIPPTESKSTPRYRVTEKQVPKDMTSRHLVRLSAVSSFTRCKILLGHIKWIFILNASRALSISSDGTCGKGYNMH
ncbi:hypothetical protein LA080_000765 [Diaporthe eres]|nr:hypothetical protein LA080_000765 [Diaporthe eres]